MEKLGLILLLISITDFVSAQNIGVNTVNPISPLHIVSPNPNSLMVEGTAQLGAGTIIGIHFAHGIESGSTFPYTSAIKSIGTSNNSARLGLFTNTSFHSNGLIERMSITDDGWVGIGTINPTCHLHIYGMARVGSFLGVGTADNPQYPLDVNGTTRLSGNVGISTNPIAGYALDVAGTVRLQNDLRINGILNPNNELNIGNAVHIESGLTVYDGKGIVRSINGTQMKIKRTTIGFSATVFGAGTTITSGNLLFGEDFSSVTVTVGQCFNGTGEWAKVFIVPFNVDLTANTCQFKVTNGSNSTIDFSGNWEIVLIGN